MWNPTVFAELHHLKAGLIFALDMVTKFKMFSVLRLFISILLTSTAFYIVTHDPTVFTMLVSGILCLGNGLYSCVTRQFNKPKNAVGKSLSKWITCENTASRSS